MTDPTKRRANGTFPKGRSGNPSGRPPKSRNMLTVFNEKRDEIVVVGKGSERLSMPRIDAMVETMWNRAINGDQKAIGNVISIMRATGQLQPEDLPETELDEIAGDVLAELIERKLKQLRGDDHAG